MAAEAAHYPAGYALFLTALSDYLEPPEKVIAVVKDREALEGLSCRLSLSTIIRVLGGPTREYPLKNDRTTFYVCRDHSCLPPVNTLNC